MQPVCQWISEGVVVMVVREDALNCPDTTFNKACDLLH